MLSIDDVQSLFTKVYTHNVEDTEKKYVHICKNCNSDKMFVESGYITCTNCNQRKRKFIDSENPEWRYFGSKDNKRSNPNRCGLPTNPLLPKSSMGTRMSYSNKYKYKMIKQYQVWNSMPYKERNLHNIFVTIKLVCKNNNLNTCIFNDSKDLYKTISEKKLSRGSNRKGLIAASVYYACKKNDVPRSSKEIAKMFNLKSTIVTKAVKVFQELYKNELFGASKPSDFVRRYCSKLKLEGKLIDLCVKILKIVIEIDLISENTPPSIAASTIYFTIITFTDLLITKQNLSKICDVSAVTISKCYNKLKKYDELIKNKYND